VSNLSLSISDIPAPCVTVSESSPIDRLAGDEFQWL